jgi:hypothetical protein
MAWTRIVKAGSTAHAAARVRLAAIGAEVPAFAGKIVCAKCGARGRHIDVRPNRKEQPVPEPDRQGNGGDPILTHQCLVTHRRPLTRRPA